MKNKSIKKWLLFCMCGAMLTGCGERAVILEEPMVIERPLPDEEQKVPVVSAGDSGKSEHPGKGVMPDASELTGDYARAAYLADMVYEANGANNLMVSPLSLNMALGMVAGGAAGQTKEELDNYLGTADYGAFAAQYMEYAKDLNVGSSDEQLVGNYRMAYEIANSVWIRDNRKLVDDYVEQVQNQYDAQIRAVSFEKDQLPKTVKQINGWCDEKTHGLIPKVVKEDTFTEDSVAVLVNSLYFESPWREKWGQTTHTFTDFAGKETTQQMLRDELTTYYENEKATAFAKDYQNGMRFIGILPKETGEFAMSELDVESLLESESTAYDVHALMPKLNFDTTADNVVDILKAQGVERVFDKEQSDMTGFVEMKDDEVTYISSIIQKTKLELDENGTKAAAVTAITLEMAITAMPMEREEKQVYLDRPFAFMIYDEVNDQIVFMGKVVNL